ncbi:hypothetical protein BOTBODRAFT_78935, partial [Botryobasidium botryosum FD-172 SS1]
YFLTQIPHPMQSISDKNAILSVDLTSIQSFPVKKTPQTFLHSCAHRFGRHLFASTIAI